MAPTSLILSSPIGLIPRNSWITLPQLRPRRKEKNDAEFRSHLEAAHALYRADFMEGLYEDWAEEQRNYYREQYLRVINALRQIVCIR